LRQVGKSGCISAAARTLGLPYKRAWLLIDTPNQGFGRPLLEAATVPRAGFLAGLTPD
jgi:molybdate transport system regulatory protein